MNINPQLPVNEDALINFSVAIARSVQYTTLENYFSRQSKITIPAMATSFHDLISFFSDFVSRY